MNTNPNFLNAYPVFIMHEQLNLHGFFEDQSLDLIWESCCGHYNDFLNSKFNDSNKSEYDCIADYVRNLMEFYTN
jgi:hypothetical protein